jgi:Tol biopolymer transport system component
VDGRQTGVNWFSQGKDVYIAKPDGTDTRRLFTVADEASYLRFSPDSTRIRFNARKNNSMSIWEIRTDSTNLHPVLPGWRNPPSECCGVWSPDGRYFFFLSNTQQNPFCPLGGNIWALRESNSVFRKHDARPFQLTAGPMLFRTLTPSPDGKKLFAEGFLARGELIRYDAQRRGFVPFLSGISASDLRFSRDGKWVAYVSYPEGTLWRSRVDGSDRLQLTSPPVIAAEPRWSPDGTQIAFMDMQTGRQWKILLVSAKGGIAQEMLAENLAQSDAEWSPDGKQIVFAHLSPKVEEVSIQLLDVNSRQVSIVPSSQGLFSPRWSPDGRFLAALSCDSEMKIVIFDFKSQKWSDWVSGPGLRAYPAWSRDGEYLYFDTYSTEAPGYYRIKLGQTRPELVVDSKDLKRSSGGQKGTWSGITPDDSPLFLRDVSTDEIYALDLELP